MTIRARRLTPAGMARFSDHLADMREDPNVPPPFGLLTDGILTSDLTEEILLERPGFKTKRDAAEYLVDTLEPISKDPGLLRDDGLWTWLALHYFDEVCPSTEKGRVVNRDPHYILDHTNQKRRYRHLLRTPYVFATELDQHNRLFLDTPLSIHGELAEQTLSRLFLIRIPAVQGLVDRLYYDEAAGRAKRGITNKKPKPGDLRKRLPTRLQQLELTYDLSGVTTEQLIELLGEEFSNWLD